jgi:hypothetical protein
VIDPNKDGSTYPTQFSIMGHEGKAPGREETEGDQRATEHPAAQFGNAAQVEPVAIDDEETGEPCPRCGRWWAHGVCRETETVWGTPVARRGGRHGTPT